MLKNVLNIVLCGCLTIVATKATSAAVQVGSPQHKLHPLYLDGTLGWASSDWMNSLNYVFPSQTSTQLSHASNGFVYGGDLGYYLNRHFSIEVGAMGLPKANYGIQSAGLSAAGTSYLAQDNGSISNWLVDLAGKVTFPVTTLSGLELFGKFGVAYRAGNFTDYEVLNGTPVGLIQPSVFDLLEPIVGGGLQYRMNEHWSINTQYLFAPYGILSTTILGPNQADHISIPSLQTVTGGLSFNF